MRYDAMLYDHDGTLVDSLPLVVAATNAVLVAHGVAAQPPPAVIAAMVLATAPRMGHHAGSDDPAVQSRLAAEFYAEARRLGPTHARAYPGIPELLVAVTARGLRQGLLSNNQGAVVRLIVDHLGLGRHLAFAWGEEDVPAPKPSPSGILQAAARLGLARERILFVGDSENDSEAAQAAGIRCVGVSWGIHPRARLATLGFDHLIDHPRELLALLES